MSRARSTPGGEIGAGLLVLLGVAAGDTEQHAERLAGKIARLRIFEDNAGKFDRSLLDTTGAARPELAEPLYNHFCDVLRELDVHVQTGVFGARMAVELVNDGPVTIILDDPRY